MSARFIPGVILASSLAVFLAACNQTSNSTLQPTPAPITTDNFGPATIQPSGTSQVFSFNESIPGSITVTITNVSPVNGYVLQINVGTVSGSACSIGFQQLASPGVGVPLSTNTAGTYCIVVADVQGNSGGPITFSGTIQHT